MRAVANEQEKAIGGFTVTGGAAEGLGQGGGGEKEEDCEQLHQLYYRRDLEHSLDKMF